MKTNRVEITNIEALTIGPEDRIILRVPATDYLHHGLGEAITENLISAGLAGRAMVIAADAGELEAIVVKPDDRDPVLVTVPAYAYEQAASILECSLGAVLRGIETGHLTVVVPGYVTVESVDRANHDRLYP